MMPSRRIALIHALEESIRPIRTAFNELWPEMETFDVFDSSLAIDRARGATDDELLPRFKRLYEHALKASDHAPAPDGVLFTCSAFGNIIEQLRLDATIPVLKPNEAAFEEALTMGGRIALVVTFLPSAALLSAELEKSAKLTGQALELRTIVADGALDALKRGDGSEHDRLVADACTRLEGDIDAIVLGQFSMARARGAVQEKTGRPVLTTPHSAVAKLRRHI